jgi:DNA polymerase III sliding clamp (beta) subunit (PCNA family)
MKMKTTMKETILAEIGGQWVARLEIDHATRPPVVLGAVIISEAEADALATAAGITETDVDAVADVEPVADVDAVAVAPVEAERTIPTGPPVAVVNRRQLAAAVKRLAATVGGKRSRALLRSVSVTIDTDAVFLTTTDGDSETVEIVNAQTAAAVAIQTAVVDFTTFRAAITATKTADVALNATEAETLLVGNARIQTTAKPDEFPGGVAAVDAETVSSAMIPADTLATVLTATVGATDNDNFRFALGGVLLDIGTGGFVRAVATDGRRLHWAESTNRTDETESVGALVPKSAVAAVCNAATAAGVGGGVCVALLTPPTTPRPADAEAEAEAEPAEEKPANVVWVRFVFFNADGFNVGEITTRVLDGRYPRWEECFKTEPTYSGHVDADTVAAALVAARPVLKMANDTKSLILSANVGGRLQLATPTGSAVSFSDSVAASMVAEIPETQLDWTFLLDAVAAAGHVESAAVGLGFTEPNSGPLHLLAANPRVIFRGLIMPLTPTRKRAEAEDVDADNVEAETANAAS